MKKKILIIGTLDTKGVEFNFVRELIVARGHEVLLVDVGVMGDDSTIQADIPATEVARAGGVSLSSLRQTGDRGASLATMSAGVAKIVAAAHEAGKFDGVISLGGSGGTSIATAAMQVLPVGVPKVMVSTMAAGDVSPYVGSRDLTLMYSVVDVAGLNRILRQVFSNAVGAICGMVEQPSLSSTKESEDRPLVAATMFGVTTPCVTAVREKLEAAGYEVLVFHATGSGGRSMEALIKDGFITGVADVTTTELCDELVGGVLSAGTDRLGAGARAGIPQVVSLGALDMVNFGAKESVPSKFSDRTLYVHNDQVTLMRTTAKECAELGKIIAGKLNRATGPTALFVPLGGVSVIDVKGQPFYDPEADTALFESLRRHIDSSKVELVELSYNLNDPEFSAAVAGRLIDMLSLVK